MQKYIKIFIVSIMLGFLPLVSYAQLQMPTTTNEGIEAKVATLFANSPEMIAVAKCESGFRQFGSSGLPLRGGTGGNYIGVFQISAGHDTTAKNLGYDIYTVDGNLGFAKYMFDRQGTRPWISCVPRSTPPAGGSGSSATPPTVASPVASAAPAATLTTTHYSLTTNLQFGITNSQVVTLQQMLNAAGFKIAESGPGSPGQETNRFGALTKEAVKRFQCSKGIACSGSESTTGYGRVGPKTRAALFEVLK